MTSPSPEKSSWFGRLAEGLKKGLKKTSQKITSNLGSLLKSGKLDEETLQALEDTLITADLGVKTSQRLIESLKKNLPSQETTPEDIQRVLAQEITKILQPVAQPLEIIPTHKPHVILMVGMNGSGKTTTLGKLAHQWHQQGFRLSVGAGDTFRAAAIEQLKVWGDRVGVPVILSAQGADPASLAYEAYEQARARQDDLLIIDTAGRLHTNVNLMAELTKIQRVLGKIDPSAPHTRLLILDSTIGQNALSQVELFKKAVDINGIIVTKLDGTAKGGVVVQMAETYGIPLYGVGVGEGIEDLQPFKADLFAKALVGLQDPTS